MKNLMKLFIVFFVVTLALESFAQKFGAKAGLDMANLNMKDDYGTYSDDFKMNPGFHVGLTAEFPLNETFSFETGLLFLTKGAKASEEDMGESYSQKINLYYLDVPLTAKAAFDIGSIRMYGVFGPYLGMGLSGKVKTEYTYDGETESDEEDIEWGSGDDDHLKRFDYGLTAGAGVEIDAVQIGISYDYGLANISSYTGDGDKIANKVLKVSLAYLFGGK